MKWFFAGLCKPVNDSSGAVTETEDWSMLPEPGFELENRYPSAQRAKPQGRRLTAAQQCIVLFLMVIAAGAVYAGLYPWGFFLGGNFHLLPYWTGLGKMHSKTAGDYFLYVEIWPSTRALETIIPHTFVKGRANLCTPKGERFYLNMSGEMRPHIYLNTVGEAIELDMGTWRKSMPIGQQFRPSFSIWGRWGRGEITGDDRERLSQSFLPDGTLRPQGSHTPPSQTEDIQVTLREGSFSEWKADCSQVRR